MWGLRDLLRTLSDPEKRKLYDLGVQKSGPEMRVRC